MSKDKGKEVAAGPSWKDKLAMLDQKYGWDEGDGSDWSDICEEDNQQVLGESRPLHSVYDSQNRPDASQSTGNANIEAAQDLPNDFDGSDEDWETENEDDEDEYESEEQDIQPMHPLAGYLLHRFGPRLRWEDRCECCEFLVDHREERRKRDRAHFAETGETGLGKDRCVLLWFRQADPPGTENVDKPVLMVTTPEGDELYPHDLQEYPDPPADSRGEWPPVSANKRQHAVAYEDEDSPDF